MKGFRIKKSDYVVAHLNVQSVYNPHTFRPLATIDGCGFKGISDVVTRLKEKVSPNYKGRKCVLTISLNRGELRHEKNIIF